MRVSRLWTAEGFLNLERAEDFLQDLLDKKWIQPVETRSDGGLSTFQVDNLVREIIVSLSDHRNLLRVTSKGSTNWPEGIRYLSVQGTVRDLNEEKLSQLRSLFMFNIPSSTDKTTMYEASTSESSENQLFPFNVKLLQVLDLTGTPLQIARDALFESTLLRYFRDTSIEVIPSSIKRLAHLEFLDLKRSLVTELPEEVGGLERIRHILIYHHENDPLMESYNLIGFKASCSIKGLRRLEKLCFVEADNSILKDLGTLTKLTRLGITKLRKEDGEKLCTSLKELKELKSLNLHAFDADEILDLHYLSSPPVSLKRLYLHGRLDKLPNWISSLCHLTKIVLRWSHLEGATQQKTESQMEAAAQRKKDSHTQQEKESHTQQEKESHPEAATQEEDLLATLGKLPKLAELELRRAYHGRQLDFKDGQFPKLKILLLDELGRLRSMSLEKGTMPCLEDLTISRCQWLERIPSGIEHIIPTLQALEFFDMSREFYKMVPDDYRNSKDKLKVYFTQWRPGQWKTIPLGIDECDECFADEL
ncbi:disease resistance RPP8-like protein 3 [Eucalyptus grandis]|uniref:disease resistance RPP8-like protein 3 n=1 Tax=Eucalyptus grandis TaxID=71139 RepID=UPI00192EA9AD|nr:disease resistance RPP8-like protein 3 [Eucalyptus grandis]